MAFDEGPGPEQVKPRSEFEQGVVGLVDKTISLWGRRLPQYIVMVGITGVALVFIQAIMLISLFGLSGYALVEFIGTSPLDAVFSLLLYSFPVDILIVIFSLSILTLVILAIVAGGAIHYALTDYENPGSGSIGESFSFASGRAMSLIGVQLLQSLIVVGLAVISTLFLFVDILIYIAMIVLILYISVRLAPSQAIVIAEEKPAIDALKRSWQITSGLFWHVFVAQLLIGIVVIIITFGITFAMGFILPFIIPDFAIIVLVVSALSSLVTSSINYIYLAVLYKDLEARGTNAGWWQ